MAATVLLVGISACVPAVEEPPLQLAANRYWPGYGPIFLAQDLGYLDRAHVVVNETPSTIDVMTAWRNGVIDIGAVTLDEAMILAERQDDVRILFVMDISEGGDALMVGPGIGRIEDLRGKRIGVERSAVGAYVLARALEMGGLSPGDVTVVPLSVDVQRDAYLRGEVDALVTHEPFITLLEADGATALVDTAQMPNEVFDVMIVRADVLSDRPDDVALVAEAWFRSLDSLESDPEAGLSAMAARSGVTKEVLEASLEGIRIPDREENDRLVSGPPPAILEPARRLEAVMWSADLLRHRVDPGQLLADVRDED
jgi:NitT/TauT family transport system substrate-binding protein